MKLNKQIKGFTLIELMIAIVILMISMTAILDFIVQYHRINLENTMRNEAMRIAEAKLEELRNTQFSAFAVGTFTELKAKPIRNLTVNYTVERKIEIISTNSFAIRVRVVWNDNRKPPKQHEHGASTIISTDVL